MIKDYFALAFKNLKKRRLRSWLTMLGIFIGIASVVALISLGAGLREAVVGQFSNLGSDKLTITSIETGFGPPGSTAVRKLNDNDLEIIKNIQGVELAVSRLVRIARVDYNGISSFKFVGSMPETKEEIDLVYNVLNANPSSGRLITTGDSRVVVLGDSVAEGIDFDKRIEVNSQLKISGENFRVIGVMEKTGSFISNLVILMPEKDMRRNLNIKDEIDLIAVQIRAGEDPQEVSERISDALRKDRKQKKGEEDFSVQTPVQTLGTINTILMIVNLIVVSIASISLLVGAIGIANTMYTSVLERTKEIGVMKSVGAKNSDIATLFLLESGLLGLAGGIIGAVLGLSLAFAVSIGSSIAFPFLSFSVSPDPYLLIGSILFSFIIGALSGLMPAIQASKLKPVQALRK